jgi:myo-inositol-1(or 4)-monophosphatase
VQRLPETFRVDDVGILRFIEDVARDAGALLMRHHGKLTRVERKGWRDLVTVADRGAEELVIARITDAFPGDAILAEETRAGQGLAPRLWILDPLDGTTNFVHRIPHFGVSLAFYEGATPVAGCVFNPKLDECYTARRGGGAFLNGAAIHVGSTQTLADALLTTGFHYRMEEKADSNLGNFRDLATRARGVRRLGSAALDLCYLADARYDGFWELHLSPWDVAAGALIAREAGARVTDRSAGEDWLFGGAIVAANDALHPQLMEVLARR